MRRTNNDMFRQLEELTVENEQLKKENRELRAENRRLRAENVRLTQRLELLEATLEERINKAAEEAVAKATVPLLETIAEKDKEILRLKSQIVKDSSNSSKPPGSNGFKQIPNNREKSGRKHGGQQGHKGTRLDIPQNLDELVEQGLAEHIILSDVPEGEAYVSDWTVDLKIITVYTEYRRSPGQPPVIQYGPQLKYIRTVTCCLYEIMKRPLPTMKQNGICVIARPARRYQDVSAAGRASLITVRYAVCFQLQKSVGKIF